MKKKVLSIALSVLQVGFIVLLLVVAVFGFSYKLPFFANKGFTFYTVISGSMEPTIPAGSVLYAGKYKLDDLKEGDIITFNQQDEVGKTTVVTHRIAETKITESTVKTPEGQDKVIKEYKYKTKGDANAAEDTTEIYANQILGKYQWHLPYLGYLTSFVQTPQGFLLLVVLPAVVLILWEIISVIRFFGNYYKEKSQQEIAKMKEELKQELKGKLKDKKKKTKKS